MLKRFWYYLKQKLKVSLSDAQSFHLHWSLTTSRFRLLSLSLVSILIISIISIAIYSRIQQNIKDVSTIQQRETIALQAKKIRSIQRQFEIQNLAFQSLQQLIKNPDKKEEIQQVSPKINANLLDELTTQPGKNQLSIEHKIAQRKALKTKFLQNFRLPLSNFPHQVHEHAYTFQLKNKITDIVSSQAGKVVFINYKSGTVILAHPYGIYTFYVGLNNITITSGQYLEQQEKIGSTSTHLEFYIMKQDRVVTIKQLNNF